MDYLVLDIEFLGEPWEGELLGVGVKPAGEPGAFYPEWGIPDQVYDWLADETLPKVTFTKADHRWLGLRALPVAGEVIDVQVMAWAVDELTELSLDACVQRYVGVTMDKRIRRIGGRLLFRCDDGTEVPLQDAPEDQLAAYCIRDLDATERLMLTLLEGLKYDSLTDYWRNECVPLSRVLVDMELAGIPVDEAAADALRETLEEEMQDLEDRLTLGAGLPPGFNIGSNDQVAQYLYERSFVLRGALPIDKAERAALKEQLARGDEAILNGMEVSKVGLKYAHGLYQLNGLGLAVERWTDTGKKATDAKTLQVYHGDHPWVRDLLAWKKRATIVQTFLRTIAEHAHEGRIYGRFNQTGTKTGRLSSNGPNMQNQPSRGPLGHAVRSLFRPEPGYVFIHGDYSQLEPRLMAHLSQDPLLLSIFREGRDIYMATAEAVFGEALQAGDPRRDLMKTYVLAMGYGAGPDKLQELLAVAGFRVPLGEVKRTLDRLKQVYRVYFAWREATIDGAADDGYVKTIGGHRRRVAKQNHEMSWKEAGHGERAMANAVVQGSAADIVARTMVRIHGEVPEVSILAQVHDELLMQWGMQGEEHDILVAIQEIAERGHGFNLTVPLVFVPRVVRTWAEGKD